MARKVIISCAITGSIHTPTMSEALPITPDQIAAQAIDAAEAGAAILHLHARDPQDGRPSPDPQIFRQFLPRIKQSCDAVVNITTGGAVTMTVEQRIAAALDLSPEERLHLAARAIAHVRANFTVARMTESTIAIYEELLGMSARALGPVAA